MVIATFVYLLIALYEWRFLASHRRKKRTYWITACFIVFAYIYTLAVILAKHFPGPNRLLELVFGT
ncbi:hypothetical protein [Paenibacillus thalictri]|uniref:Uncharacterized protein n=1 Tax=Paenibacillus thalictri TaxID=2527873 RepID=A0A4Q9DM69_9BACL|nr:hypothetical protein [Paenibacillus thalictri]TBL75698.1 hypothetical protein EYB31_22150 [Paenibacillus thalictri]